MKFLLCVTAALWATLSTASANAQSASGGASPSDTSAAAGVPPDGLQVQLAMLSPVSTGSATKTSTSTTPGVEFTYKKDFDLPWQANADYSTIFLPGFSVSSSGKAAFNQSVNVGDLIDVSASGFWRMERPGPETQWRGFVGLSGNAAVDVGQKFNNAQVYYGAAVQAHVAGPVASTTAEVLDVFDWPGKLIRLASLKDWDVARQNWNASWPTFTAELDRVKAESDPERKAADPSLSPFNREHFAASFASKLGEYQHLNIVFSMKVDDWEEVDPIKAIRAAHLNRQNYVEFGIREQKSAAAGSGWQLTYGKGQVPTDQASSKTWQVGYNFVF